MLLVDRLMRAWLMRGKKTGVFGRWCKVVVLRLPSLFQRALRFAIRRALKSRGHAPPRPQFTPHTWPDTPDSPTAVSSCLHYDKTEPAVQAAITWSWLLVHYAVLCKSRLQHPLLEDPSAASSYPPRVTATACPPHDLIQTAIGSRIPPGPSTLS